MTRNTLLPWNTADCASAEQVPVLPSTLERHRAKFIVDQKTGCWNWIAARFTNGYGHVYVGGGKKNPKHAGAHRYFYKQIVGDIPDNLQIVQSFTVNCEERGER